MPLKLKAGDVFPDASLPDDSGDTVTLSEVAGGSPLVLTFYRGYW